MNFLSIETEDQSNDIFTKAIHTKKHKHGYEHDPDTEHN